MKSVEEWARVIKCAPPELEVAVEAIRQELREKCAGIVSEEWHTRGFGHDLLGEALPVSQRLQVAIMNAGKQPNLKSGDKLTIELEYRDGAWRVRG